MVISVLLPLQILVVPEIFAVTGHAQDCDPETVTGEHPYWSVTVKL